MIRASGTAMVEPANPIEPAFAVPVTVAPHSLQQVYSILTDEEVEQPRSRLFRGLEFVGALAAAAQGTFSFGAQAAKNVALFTGIVVPEGKKLWPDRWPGYQRNLVNYAMPDLLKVPSGSVVDHKFLFFSKKDVDGLISDANLFTVTDDTGVSRPISGERAGAKPKTFVISLAFDTLDVRFERVFPVAKFGTRDTLLSLSSQAADLGAQYDSMHRWISSASPSETLQGLTRPEWDAAQKAVKTLQGTTSKLPDALKDRIKSAASGAQALLDALAPKGTPAAGKDGNTLTSDLFSKAPTGEAAVSDAASRLKDILQRLNGGVDPELFSEDAASLGKTVEDATRAMAFYRGAATTLKRLVASLQALAQASSSGDATAAATALSDIEPALEDLKRNKPSVVTLALQ
jgi:hypothetical protein